MTKTVEEVRRKPIYGIGINDFKGSVSIVKNINGKKTSIWRCKIYNTWVHMLARCYSQASLRKRPRYAGCYVSEEWHIFSNFRLWMSAQDHEGKHLDKDILFDGNRIYGPETCVFISAKLNTFLSDRLSARGEYPIGVCWSKDKSKFHAQCNNPFTGKRGHIGYFSNPSDAAIAWLEKKHEYACAYAQIEADERVAARLREMFAPPSNKPA